MNKLKLSGIIAAFVLLILALAAKIIGTGTSTFILPLMALITAALAVIDIIIYRKKQNDTFKAGAIVRIISLIVITLLLLTASVINIIL